MAANDSNPDNSPLTYHLDGLPLHGTVTLNPDGSFKYTAIKGYVGYDRFGYYVSDGFQNSNTSSVILACGTALYVPNASPSNLAAVAQNFPNSLKGLWASYMASKQRLTDVANAMTVFGNAAEAVGSIDPDSEWSNQAIDIAIARMDDAYAAYDAYVVQLKATLSAAGLYQKSIRTVNSKWDNDVLKAIYGLPLDVVGLDANKNQLQRLQVGLSNFAAGTDYLIANDTFSIEMGTATHDALNQVIAYLTLAEMGVTGVAAGRAIYSQKGIKVFAKAAVTKIASLGAAYVANRYVASNAAYVAQLTGFSPDTIRTGGDFIQLVCLFKALKAERAAVRAQRIDAGTGARELSKEIPLAAKAAMKSGDEAARDALTPQQRATAANNYRQEGKRG